VTLVTVDELGSDEGSMIVITEVVGITRSQTLEIDNVGAFVATSDAFKFNGTSEFHSFTVGRVNNRVCFDAEHLGQLEHKLMELSIGNKRFLLINSAVLSKRAQV
jgi:hypothetical protein